MDQRVQISNFIQGVGIRCQPSPPRRATANGADGNTPAGDALQADYAHPSQFGNNAIAELLAEVDVSSATG